ncbi:hypothetical protein [Klebsiella michiganensis]|uniref:hypothetical protein n=1 Tax=Klebsiella michiganensis TaxID=1134687 RepID=UPI001CCB1E5C|nr:hypothetical protein [Klebsiella michiganensis]MBZ7392404.1 hypothetical protein [Klebsiella michiganensis]MDL4446312.1 hypothetical protein [Klebsiella michiganensis]MDL4490892.1 hypothetical protein [Klebsiella michiganensis]MDL4659635.1 hypothetical protein [Klebsiella michiganensis]
MTNNQLTEKQLAVFASPPDNWPCPGSAGDIMSMAAELQERRKAVEDKDLQGVIEALEHPAGINAAGKQVVRQALAELQERRKVSRECKKDDI